jgi:hypothetical protein
MHIRAFVSFVFRLWLFLIKMVLCVYSLSINSLYTESLLRQSLKYRKNTDESPICSFQSDRIKMSLLRNEKTNILQGKNSSSIQSDQMNRRRIFVLLLLLLLLLAVVTTNPLIKEPLLCRWCTWCLVAAAHRRGFRSVVAARGRWWQTPREPPTDEAVPQGCHYERMMLPLHGGRSSTALAPLHGG